MMSNSSSLLEEILDGLTGVQRHRIREVLAAEGFDRLTDAEMRVLMDRISGEIVQPRFSFGFISRPWDSTGLGLFGGITRAGRR